MSKQRIPAGEPYKVGPESGRKRRQLTMADHNEILRFHAPVGYEVIKAQGVAYYLAPPTGETIGEPIDE